MAPPEKHLPEVIPAADFRPGFRIDAIDIAVLAAGVGGAVAAGRFDTGLALVVALPVANFFLFCNVFRVARPLELAWAALFVAAAAGTLLGGWPGWPGTVALCTAGTAAVIGLQARRPSYHGIGWRRLNPGLPAWWAEARHPGDPGSPGR